MQPINGVNIGDKFRVGKTQTATVVDILEKISLASGGALVGHICVARADGNYASNNYEVPFSTVVRNRLQPV